MHVPTTSNGGRITNELSIYRRLLVVAGVVYLVWWFGVELLLPQSFNPLYSRLAVVGLIFLIFGLSMTQAFVQERIEYFFAVAVWSLTLHYFYLFYENQADLNWIIGAYITVMAICLCFLSARNLLGYTFFVLVLSVVMVVLLPQLETSIFLPGLLTILLQANLGLRSRLKVLKVLEDSNTRFRLLVDSAFEGVCLFENRRIVDVNEALLKITSYTRDELLDQDPLILIHPQDRALVEGNMTRNDGHFYETRVISKWGHVIEVEVRGKNFRYENRLARLVTIQTIGDRKRAERDRLDARHLAENVRIRDEFISVASHELKTPLSSLKLQTQIIERDIQKKNTQKYTPEVINECIEMFHRQINRLTELVESMLDVSRISSGRLEIEHQTIDLEVLMRDVFAALDIERQRPGSELTTTGPILIPADPSRIKQVLENLLGNALKYGNNKPIHVSLRREDLNALISVQDHGIGIAPDALQRIFNRFERAVSGRNISGLGLGLYISKQIVESHGGHLSVESTLSDGSTFSVRLPLLP